MSLLKYIILFLISMPIFVCGQTTSIYDIQYTTNPGNGTYPSPYEGQTITTGGIVTAIDFNGENYFISSSNGGAWNGLYIYDDDYSPAIGDSILLTGEVYEYNGLTEIKDLSSVSIINSGNPLPQATQLSTNMVYNQEAFESVFVQINNIHVTQTYDEWGEWRVDDGSGSCVISYLIYDLQESGFPLIQNYSFSIIKGIISYSWGGYRLHPRGESDIQSLPGEHILSVNDKNIYSPDIFSVPVKISIFNQSTDITSYHLELVYSPSIIEFAGLSLEGTLSQQGIVEDLSYSGHIILNFNGSFSYNGVESLLKLNFLPLEAGSSNVGFEEATINNIAVEFTFPGSIDVNFNGQAIGDTLTVIQRPILNIPEIVLPGEMFDVICIAPENTTDWQISISFNNIEQPLEIVNTGYSQQLERWTISVVTPLVDLYELYDLKITGSGGLWDVSKNAIKLLPEEKEDFYFVHITDTHLPTHYYYEDPQSAYDTSELIDMREVINDINLINPEFVLLTGDFINEGELEDFENRRNHTKAQRILGELEVPVYLVAGNHDLGGWDATPPPQGTARNEWWRFFGWPWLKDGSYFTQDYSFEYGQVHFTGLESYVNYDGYLFNIYSDESFIPTQLEWLELELLYAPQDYSKVLFYHMDFADQLNLSQLGVDMALYGHIHHNEGSIYSSPYNLATDNLCDNDRAYRMIKVNGGELQPLNTLYAGNSGNKLKIDYEPSNIGQADSVVATITNQQAYSFEHGLIKFVMPKGNFNYLVQNGTLLQIDSTGNYAVCYVEVNIPANNDALVTVTVDSISGIGHQNKNPEIIIYPPSPNPFLNEIEFGLWLGTPQIITINIYDISGIHIVTLVDNKMGSGYHTIKWDGNNKFEELITNRVFICSITTQSGFKEVIRIIKI